MLARNEVGALALGLTILAGLAPGPARADTVEACVSSATNGQRLQREGKLQAARTQYLACVAPACPAQVKTVCERLLSGVEASVPTVILSARDASGQDLVDVKVQADGAPFADSLDGKAVTLDPGPHLFRFEGANGATADLHVVIKEGEKNRSLSIILTGPAAAPAAAPPPEQVDRPVPVLAFVFAGVGAVSLGAFTYLAIHGQSQYDDCRPNLCSQSTADSLSLQRDLAWGALGLGLVSAGVATWLFVTRPAAPRAPSLSVGVVGAQLWAKGTF